MKKYFKLLILFALGFMTYITIEVCWRGYSYPLMGICGGLVVVLLDIIGSKISWDVDIVLQGAMGSVIITLLELIIGELFLRGFLPVMWDYSNVFLNYKGIICLPFSLAWIGLSIIAVVVGDSVDYYLFDGDQAPYYKLFGKTVLRLKAKQKTA